MKAQRSTSRLSTNHIVGFLHLSNRPPKCEDPLSTVGIVKASPEVGSLLAKMDVAFFGWVWFIVEKWEYSLYAKDSLCQFFYCGGEERACRGFRMRIVLSTALIFLSALLFLSAALELLFLSSSPHWPFNCIESPSR